MNDTAKPMAMSSVLLPPANSWRFLKASNAKAPTMVGIASQNENSVAARLSAPNSMAATIEAPERDTPGIIDRHWQTPMPRYIGSENLVASWYRGLRSRRSIH